jgi:hypothetical protein
MKKTLATITVCLLITGLAQAQESSQFNAGFGFGIDYGGFGARLTYIPVKRLGIFGSLGYNLVGAGYNVGAQIRFPSEKKVNWYIAAMYGYNAVLKITGDLSYEKIYYGFSTGAGLELKSGNGKNFWNFELLIPFRDPKYQDDIDKYEDLGAEFSTKPLPVSFSIGYHIGF